MTVQRSCRLRLMRYHSCQESKHLYVFLPIRRHYLWIPLFVCFNALCINKLTKRYHYRFFCLIKGIVLIRLRNNTGWLIPNNLAVHSLAYAILIAVRKCLFPLTTKLKLCGPHCLLVIREKIKNVIKDIKIAREVTALPSISVRIHLYVHNVFRVFHFPFTADVNCMADMLSRIDFLIGKLILIIAIVLDAIVSNNLIINKRVIFWQKLIFWQILIVTCSNIDLHFHFHVKRSCERKNKRLMWIIF